MDKYLITIIISSLLMVILSTLHIILLSINGKFKWDDKLLSRIRFIMHTCSFVAVVSSLLLIYEKVIVS